MLKHITGTFFTRVLVSVLNFCIIILTSRLLGAEARGSISLAMLAIAIAGLINEIIGGPAVVYLIPRYNNQSIAKYAYFWALASGIVCSTILAYLNFYDLTLLPYVCAASMLLGLGSIHQFILLGHQKISSFNTIALMQSLILFTTFISFVLTNNCNIISYFIALITGYLIALIYGLFKTNFIWKFSTAPSQKINLKILFNNGLLTQIASITHLLSSRVTFYFSTNFISLAFVGVLSTAVSITEAAMIFSSSVALITASTVANSNDKTKAINTTIQLIKLSIIISLIILFILAVFPESLMSNIFGKDFSGIKIIIFTLLPGVLAGSISQVISHYYSGTGRFKVNATVGFISLLVTIMAGLIYYFTSSILLPGSIISTSAIVAMIYFVRLFIIENNLKIADIIPNKNDARLLMQKLNNKD